MVLRAGHRELFDGKLLLSFIMYSFKTEKGLFDGSVRMDIKSWTLVEN